MSSTLGDLTTTLRTLLMEHFRATTPAVEGQPFLAFELGTPIPDDTFRLRPGDPEYSPVVALEYLSHQANVAPRVQDGVLFATSNRIDNLYEILLAGATASDPGAMELLGRVKRSALASFDETLGSVSSSGIERFRPVHADPINWYDQTVAGNWTRLALDQFDEPPPPPPTPPTPTSPPPSHPFPDSPKSPFPVMWRPVPRGLQSALSGRVTTAGVRRFNEEARVAAGSGLAVAGAGATRLRSLVADVPVIEAPAAPRVTSDGFSISIDVCLVHLRRPWFGDGLLNLSGWFVPSVARGSFSDGTGAGNATPLSVLPVACVCIRNLAIKARWNDADRQQVETSSHLGAFALMGRLFDHNTATLTVQGMQCIAWICQPMPRLPPQDPA
jgi:hypothetical protein